MAFNIENVPLVFISSTIIFLSGMCIDIAVTNRHVRTEYHPIIAVERQYDCINYAYSDRETKAQLTKIASLFSDDEIKTQLCIRYDICNNALSTWTNLSIATVKYDQNTEPSK
jgi:hypothetical protein